MKNTDRRAPLVVGFHYEGTGLSRTAARIWQGSFSKRNRADETAALIPMSITIGIFQRIWHILQCGTGVGPMVMKETN
ncbi:hypothetical protein [Desulfosudis oleivorans]|nr:hypothetical protein [Desulfosudis oleivorans]